MLQIFPVLCNTLFVYLVVGKEGVLGLGTVGGVRWEKYIGENIAKFKASKAKR